MSESRLKIGRDLEEVTLGEGRFIDTEIIKITF